MEDINVIFLDFDGVLDTNYYQSNEQVEEKIKILADICHEFNAKIVISASAKDAIDEETLYVDPECEWVTFLFSMFKKYNIEVYGRTPNVARRDENHRLIMDIWKEDEIRLYLAKHPEIAHYCVIDDDDLKATHRKSDLDRVRDHLVVTNDFLRDNPLSEGIMPYHKELVGEILRKENNMRDIAILRRKMGN